MADPTSFVPLYNKLDLVEAYKWGREEIYDFLEDVTENHTQYGVCPGRAAKLKEIKDHLKRLSLPEGEDFKAGETLKPDQHIYRSRNQNWPPNSPEPPTISKFIVKEHQYSDCGHGRGSKRHGYWSPYDLLGLFLSLVGPAPAGANKADFYIPMTAVYGRWCLQIAGELHGGVGDSPNVFQCTWREEPGQPTLFFLGSSLAGYSWDNKEETGAWKTVLQRARFELISQDMQGDYNFDWSPVMESVGKTVTRFGNCAETYPFIALLKGHDPLKEKCYGVALRRRFLQKMKYYDGQVIRKYLKDPCLNCVKLIEWYSGEEGNFLCEEGGDGERREQGEKK